MVADQPELSGIHGQGSDSLGALTTLFLRTVVHRWAGAAATATYEVPRAGLVCFWGGAVELGPGVGPARVAGVGAGPAGSLAVLPGGASASALAAAASPGGRWRRGGGGGGGDAWVLVGGASPMIMSVRGGRRWLSQRRGMRRPFQELFKQLVLLLDLL